MREGAVRIFAALRSSLRAPFELSSFLRRCGINQPPINKGFINLVLVA